MCNCKSLLLQEKAKHREQNIQEKKATDLSEIAKSFEHSEKLQLFWKKEGTCAESRQVTVQKSRQSVEIF